MAKITPGNASSSVSISDNVAKYAAHGSCLDLVPNVHTQRATMFKKIPPTISTGSTTRRNPKRTASMAAITR